jgi:hypothetical protein
VGENSGVRATQTASGVTLTVQLEGSDFCRPGDHPYYSGCATVVLPAGAFSLSADLQQGSVQARATLKACIKDNMDRSAMLTSGKEDPNFKLTTNPFDGVKIAIDVAGTCDTPFAQLPHNFYGPPPIIERLDCEGVSETSSVFTIGGKAAGGVDLSFADVYVDVQ